MSAPARLVRATFHALEEHDIRSVCLRNHEDLPYRIGNDLDILVEPGSRGSAELAIVGAAAEAGWGLVHRTQFVPTGLYFLSDDATGAVQIDLYDELSWLGFEFFAPVACLREARRVGPHHVAPHAAEWAVTLLSNLLYGKTVRDKYRPGAARVAEAEFEALTAALSSSTGKILGRRLASAVRRSDWSELERLARRTRVAVVARNLRRPVALAARQASRLLRLMRRWRRPPGLMVVLLGVDGSGKSTAARALLERLDGVFAADRSRLIHWRPTVSAPSRAPRPAVSDPHGQTPRPAPVSAVFLLYHWLRFVVGSWVGIQPALFRNGLVVCDRYYHDFLVDQRRYRLSLPAGIVRAMARGFRRPDLAFVLDVDEREATRRKQEIPLAELARLRTGYRQLALERPPVRLVDAGRSEEQVIGDLVAACLSETRTRAHRA